jgi:hypothetical protein
VTYKECLPNLASAERETLLAHPPETCEGRCLKLANSTTPRLCLHAELCYHEILLTLVLLRLYHPPHPLTNSNETASLLHEFITHNQSVALSWGSCATEVQIWLHQAEARGSASIEHGLVIACTMDSVLRRTGLGTSILHSKAQDHMHPMVETRRMAAAAAVDDLAVEVEGHSKLRTR